jgi:cobalt-zinc-cadmium efflux system outer membrane protein
MKIFGFCSKGCLSLVVLSTALATPLAVRAADRSVYTLNDLIGLAQRSNPALASMRARVAGAQAALLTAQAYPNPDIDVLAGRQSGSTPAVATGSSGNLGFMQPLERPSLRQSRRDVAVAGIDLSEAAAGSSERDLIAAIKLRYLEVLRLRAAARLAQDDRQTAEQIRARVAVRVSTGESARFELIRAETERLNALRAAQTAALSADRARIELRRLVGAELPADFELAGSIEDASPAPRPLEAMRRDMLERHPELQIARAQLRSAEAKVALERERAKPAFALRGGLDRVPQTLDARLGLVMTVPIFDRREGPIAEALADVDRSRFALTSLEQTLNQLLDSAWQQYQIALSQVNAYESGILREAESALKVAEASYRFGERGILDYLDAQRTFRMVRNELNTTRHDLRAALAELERLSLTSEQP